MNKFSIVLIATAVLSSLPMAANAADQGAPRDAVLVTGASSGIGLNVTRRLAAEGYVVYAGARKPDDLERLNAMKNVESLRLDVTVANDIERAVERVRDDGHRLAGVVNNAGIALFGPMNSMTESDIEWVFDVNVLGPVRINKAFAPLLLESGGRTTLIGSINGFISGPGAGTYAMSKFAVEAYTDALAAELASDGVKVSIVEPGAFRSGIREKVTRHALGVGETPDAELTEEQRTRLDEARQRNAELDEPDAVADAVLHALFADQPRRRYMVTPTRRQAEVTLREALARVAQLNTGQPFELTRDELVALLDEQLEVAAATRSP